MTPAELKTEQTILAKKLIKTEIKRHGQRLGDYSSKEISDLAKEFLKNKANVKLLTEHIRKVKAAEAKQERDMLRKIKRMHKRS